MKHYSKSDTSSSSASSTSTSAAAAAANIHAWSWNSPVPYLFGCLAAIFVLIFVALFVLAWAHCKKLHRSSSSSSAGAGAGAEVQETPAATGTMSIENDEESITIMQPKILVIMAGNDKPTCIATPISLISITNSISST
ncbi:PREDICTED: protein GLUTAMINE DUMPER 6-like [Ipomoea nil]|uniref:protein GLUTAMINE DUMPER 6-like n=1 Tax=Ipomoea nil TaxID=35883 RepID=UPI00090138C9|nr:PREDICTED: protein GLUTAMINE DUMPER 6-like [Ipomoea nil]